MFSTLTWLNLSLINNIVQLKNKIKLEIVYVARRYNCCDFHKKNYKSCNTYSKYNYYYIISNLILSFNSTLLVIITWILALELFLSEFA